MITQPKQPSADLGANVTNEILNSLLLQPITAKFIDKAAFKSVDTLEILKLFVTNNISNVYDPYHLNHENVSCIFELFNEALDTIKQKHNKFYTGFNKCVDEAVSVLERLDANRSKKVRFVVNFGMADIDGQYVEEERDSFLLDIFKTLVIHKIFVTVVYVIKENMTGMAEVDQKYNDFITSNYPFEISNMLNYKLDAFKISDELKESVGIFMKDTVEFDAKKARKQSERLAKNSKRYSDMSFMFLHGMCSYFAETFNFEFTPEDSGGVIIAPVIKSRRASAVLFFQYVLPMMDIPLEDLNFSFDFLMDNEGMEETFNLKTIKSFAKGKYDPIDDDWFDVFSIARENHHACRMTVVSEKLLVDIHVAMDADSVYIYVS